jgi:ABC-type transporter Mla subunit MlaD
MARAMVDLQNQLLEETEFGRSLRESVGELEAATKALQDAGQGLTRDKLLDLILQSPNDARLRAYATIARGGMDYQFFQLLSERIDKASGDERARLEGIRQKLLDFTNEIDKQIEARYKQAQEFVDSLLAQEDIVRAVRDNLNNFTQDAVDVVNQMLRQASEKNDYTRMGKLQKMVEVLREVSTPPEVAFIEQLLDAPDDVTLNQMLEGNQDLLNDQFMEALVGLVAQVDQASEQGNPEAKALGEKLSKIYKTALKYSMQKNMGEQKIQ